MGLQNRIDSLKVKHATLKHELDVQSKIPHRNEMALSALKKRKLAIKDEIERINIH